MPIKPSTLFTIYDEVNNPPKELIDLFDQDEMKAAEICRKPDNTTRRSLLNGFFWAKLNEPNDSNPIGMFTIIYSKKSINTGKAYGGKIAAPNPPFAEDQAAGTKYCDDGH